MKADDDAVVKFEKRGAYFHLFAWSVPLILTIAVIFLNAIEGDPLTGICFISHHARVGQHVRDVVLQISLQ